MPTQETLAGDAALLGAAAAAIAALNRRYAPGPAGDRFLLLHRQPRLQRRRGRLDGLGAQARQAARAQPPAARRHRHHLHGRRRSAAAGARPACATSSRSTPTPGCRATPRARLIGKMAHPLNRPTLRRRSEARRRAATRILQPRVTPSLPVGPRGLALPARLLRPRRHGSLRGGGLRRLPGPVRRGLLHRQGHLRRRCLRGGAGRPGAGERAAQPRSVRGHLRPRRPRLRRRGGRGVSRPLRRRRQAPASLDARRLAAAALDLRAARRDACRPSIGRGKMLDNLRRSLLAPLTAGHAVGSAGCCRCRRRVVATLAGPRRHRDPGLSADLLRRRAAPRGHPPAAATCGTLAADLRLAALQTVLAVAFLADQAWRMVDAIVRTLVRLFCDAPPPARMDDRRAVDRRAAARTSRGFYRQHGGRHCRSGLLHGRRCRDLAPASWPLVAALRAALAGGAGARPVGQPVADRRARGSALSEPDARELAPDRPAHLALSSRPSSPPADNMLPPDNFQEDPEPVVAHRTSPTNIGLYLLSAVAARDFGWAGTTETVERLEATLAHHAASCRRFNGHFYNWYDTRDLRVLDPAYVSSVDSGNLAGHLIALANACEEWRRSRLCAEMPRRGHARHASAGARGAADALPNGRAARRQSPPCSTRSATSCDGAQAARGAVAGAGAAGREGGDAPPSGILPAGADDDDASDLVFWIEALQRRIGRPCPRPAARCRRAARSRRRDCGARRRRRARWRWRWISPSCSTPSASCCRSAIRVADNRLDPSCYDLLASEARLASLFAIAKGDVPTRHWFRLGRAATPLGSGLGADLVVGVDVRVPDAVAGDARARGQPARADQPAGRGAPAGLRPRRWACPGGSRNRPINARDLEFTYQYSNFGVPGLGLKRGLAEQPGDRALRHRARRHARPAGRAARTSPALPSMGAMGRYGFYEALDFTQSRLPEGAERRDRAQLHGASPGHDHRRHRQRAAGRADARALPPRADDPGRATCCCRNACRAMSRWRIRAPRRSSCRGASPSRACRRCAAHVGPLPGAPVTHLLSNGRYAVMLTATGAGYSRWGEIAVTRWREDATRDDCGLVRLSARHRERGGLVGRRRSRWRASADHAEVRVRRGPGRVHPPRRRR